MPSQKYTDALMFALGQLGKEQWIQQVEYFESQTSRADSTDSQIRHAKLQLEHTWKLMRAVDKYYGTCYVGSVWAYIDYKKNRK